MYVLLDQKVIRGTEASLELDFKLQIYQGGVVDSKLKLSNYTIGETQVPCLLLQLGRVFADIRFACDRTHFFNPRNISGVNPHLSKYIPKLNNPPESLFINSEEKKALKAFFSLTGVLNQTEFLGNRLIDDSYIYRVDLRFGQYEFLRYFNRGPAEC